MAMVQCGFKIERETLERLNRIAEESGTRISALIRLVLEGVADMGRPAAVECGKCGRWSVVSQRDFRFCPYCCHRLGEDPPFVIRSP